MDKTFNNSGALLSKIILEYFFVAISNHFIRISLLDLLICEPS